MLLRVLATALVALCVGCGTADDGESPTGLGVGENGLLEFEATPVGDLQEGPNDFELAVRDAKTKEPAAGAVLSVRVHMAAMGHEAPVRPELAEVDPGEFFVGNVVFTMPGRWEIEVAASHQGRTDTALLAYDIP
jgi:hypothetical protein